MMKIALLVLNGFRIGLILAYAQSHTKFCFFSDLLKNIFRNLKDSSSNTCLYLEKCKRKVTEYANFAISPGNEVASGKF